MKTHFAIAFFLLMIIAVPGLAVAQAPCFPNGFEGTATVNGNPAPAGLQITATINGQPASINNVEGGSVITGAGEYGYEPNMLDVYDPDSNCENVHTIEFFINGQPAGNALFVNGQVTVLNLSATGVQYCGDGSCNNGETCSSCTGDCGPCSTEEDDDDNGGGGGNGGGNGGTYTPLTTECAPDWVCSQWSQCIDGVQERTCTDANACGTDEGKPAEEQECGLEALLPGECDEGETTCVGDDVFQCDANSNWHDVESCEFGCGNGACLEESDAAQEDGGPITGMFLNLATGLGLLVLIIILCAGYLLWKRRAPSSPATPV